MQLVKKSTKENDRELMCISRFSPCSNNGHRHVHAVSTKSGSSKLSFDNHVSKLCQKASNKLYALARISPYMDQRKLRTLMRAFITSQVQYCPLIWMFHGRQLNNKINKIQERALRISYKDAEATYGEL